MNEAAFLSALHESPGDEATWLALADWLEENGQSERAELVRLMRQLRAAPVMVPTLQRVALEGRIAALLEAGVRPVVPEVSNGVGMRLALIEPGRFCMGSTAGEKARGKDEDAHEVELSRGFYLGVHPVTRTQYREVMGRDPSRAGGSARGEKARFPVGWVTWQEAVDFCAALTRREGAAPGYRLPTEAEWEYACRAGSSAPFHFGHSASSTQANFHGDQPYGGAKRGPDIGGTCAVGQYRPNAWGLYDMHGNVWEWCADWFGKYKKDGLSIDPAGPSRGTMRVIRGGSAGCHGAWCRAANRGRISPDGHFESVGFRVVLPSPAS